MEKINVTPKVAAELLNISRSKMLNLLERGDVPAYKEGTHWKIPYRLLQSYAESRAISEAKDRSTINADMLIDWEEESKSAEVVYVSTL